MTEKKNKFIAVKITEKEHKLLNDVCEALHISKSAYIRQMLHDSLIEGGE